MKTKNKQGLSRRKFLGATVGVAGGMAAGALPILPAQVTSRAPVPEQELTLINGRIHTMDARNTVATAVTIRNGRFVSVGDAAQPSSPGARVIDLKGRTV